MLRTATAVVVGKTVRALARRRGGGSAFPGLVAERIDPKILRHALSGVRGGIVVVSGTNGKTTTTKMLVAVLRAHGRTVFTNPTGSNFTRGVISEMLPQLPLRGRLTSDLAVVELDEAHAMRFIAEVPPTHSLLLNVARDQLDRFAEIDQTAALLGRLAAASTVGVVVNADDSFVVRAVDDLTVPVRLFGLDESIAHRLHELTEFDARSGSSARPREFGSGDARLRPSDERVFDVVFPDVTVGPVTLQQRGLAAMINATAAVTTARMLLGEAFDVSVTADALAAVRPPFGRGEVIEVAGQPLELVLVKNPAGFGVALSTYGTTPAATMIAINDNDADGRDVSWLYDVSFASLRERGVAMTSGVRCYDMALRLHHDDVVTDEVVPDLVEALDAFLAAHPHEPKRLFCTYTAMMALRRTLAARHGLAQFGEDGPQS